MSSGNNFSQMMQSLSFNPFGGFGGSGSGMGGSMATGGMANQPPGLMGGESLLSGPIAKSLTAGRTSGAGPESGGAGGASTEIDREAAAQNSLSSSRETATPETQALFREYQNLTDAYFRTLTQPAKAKEKK